MVLQPSSHALRSGIGAKENKSGAIPWKSVAFGQVVLAEGLLQQTIVDLAERDGQRLFLILVLHQRADVLQQTSLSCVK